MSDGYTRWRRKVRFVGGYVYFHNYVKTWRKRERERVSNKVTAI